MTVPGWLPASAAGLTITEQVTMDQTRPYATVTLAATGEPLADPLPPSPPRIVPRFVAVAAKAWAGAGRARPHGGLCQGARAVRPPGRQLPAPYKHRLADADDRDRAGPQRSLLGNLRD